VVEERRKKTNSGDDRSNGGIPAPIRGGNSRNNRNNGHIANGPSVTSQFFNQNLRGTTPSSSSLLPKYGMASPSFGSVASSLTSPSLSSLNGHGRAPSARHLRNESTRQNGHTYKKSTRSVRAESYW